jgi:hypothetical protein
MKKFLKVGVLALVMTLVAAFGLTACGGDADPKADAAGKYKWTETETNAMGGKDTFQFDLKADGTTELSLLENDFLTDKWIGNWEIDGNKVTITALTIVIPNPQAPDAVFPGLWNWIDKTNGNTEITIDKTAKTFTPARTYGSDELPPPPAEGDEYTYSTPAGIPGLPDDNFKIVLNADLTVVFTAPGHPIVNGTYTGTYVKDGNTVTITGLKDAADAAPAAIVAWIVSGNCVVTIDTVAGTFEPVTA